jgi:hypothetical protein
MPPQRRYRTTKTQQGTEHVGTHRRFRSPDPGPSTLCRVSRITPSCLEHPGARNAAPAPARATMSGTADGASMLVASAKTSISLTPRKCAAGPRTRQCSLGFELGVVGPASKPEIEKSRIRVTENGVTLVPRQSGTHVLLDRADIAYDDLSGAQSKIKAAAPERAPSSDAQDIRCRTSTFKGPFVGALTVIDGVGRVRLRCRHSTHAETWLRSLR